MRFSCCYFISVRTLVSQLPVLGDINIVMFLYIEVSGFDNSDVLTGRSFGGLRYFGGQT